MRKINLLAPSAYKNSEGLQQESWPFLFNPEDKRDVELLVGRASRVTEK